MRFKHPALCTWNVVALGLNARGEVGVLGDGMAVVVERRVLIGDLGVSRHQHRRQHCRKTNRCVRRRSFWEGGIVQSLGSFHTIPGLGFFAVPPLALEDDSVCWFTWRLHPLVMVGVDADLVLLGVKGVLAHLDGPQLVVAVQVRPAPQPAVDDVRQALPVRHLQPAVQRPARRDTV